ncbi:MAG: hypothetical protein ACKO9Z_03770 [Planctomycetota bacterium]
MRRPRSRLTVSTFPFLAVLLCAMGALILLLLVFDRRAKEAAKARAESKAQAAHDAERLEHQRRLEKILAHNAAARQEDGKQSAERKSALEKEITANKTREASLRDAARNASMILAEAAAATAKDLGAVEMARDAIGRLEARRNEVHELRRKAGEQKTRLDEERSRQERDLARLEAVLARVRAERERDRQTYSIVPYRGKQGENRKPLYIECSASGLVFLPDRLEIDPVAHPRRALDEIDRRADEQNKRLKAMGLQATQRPYLMLLVRPDGIGAYYRFQVLTKPYDIDFGYELVDADWVLDIPAEVEQQVAGATSVDNRPRNAFPGVRIPGNGAAGGGFASGTTGSTMGGSTRGGTGPLGATTDGGSPGGTSRGNANTGAGGIRFGYGPGDRTENGSGIGGLPGIPGGGIGLGSGGRGPTGATSGNGVGGTGVENGTTGSGIGGIGNGPGGASGGGGFANSPGANGNGLGGLPGNGPGGTGTSPGGNGSPDQPGLPGIPGGASGSNLPRLVLQPEPDQGQAEGGSGVPGGSGAGGQGGSGSTRGGAGGNPTGQGIAGGPPGGAEGMGQGSAGGPGGAPGAGTPGAGMVLGNPGGPLAPITGPPPLPPPNPTTPDQRREDPDKPRNNLAGGQDSGGGSDPAGGTSGGGLPDPDADDLAPLGRVLVPLPRARDRNPPSRPMRLAKLSGSAELVLFVECRGDGAIVHPGGRKFSIAELSPDNNPLVEELKRQVERRKALARPGDVVPKAHVRYLVWNDGLRSYHAIYPLLMSWDVLKSQQSIETKEELREALRP